MSVTTLFFLYFRVKFSLNEIAQESTVSLIKNVLQNGVNVAEIYVDTVGPPEKYQVNQILHTVPFY